METTFSELAARTFRKCVINSLRSEPVASALLPTLIREMRSLSTEILGVDLVKNWKSFNGAILEILDNPKLKNLIAEQIVGKKKGKDLTIQFSFNYPPEKDDKYNAKLSFYFKKNPQLDIATWENILEESFGAIIDEIEALTSKSEKLKKEPNVFKSTKQIMHVVEQIRKNIQFSFSKRKIQTPITIYESRCRSMFYYTTEALTTRSNRERVNDFLRFIERVKNDDDYREFIEVTLERKDNPGLVRDFNEMIKSFAECSEESRENISDEQQKKIESIMPYIPQEPFSGLYSRLPSGEIILWRDTDNFPYDLNDDHKKFFPCWSTIYPFERQFVGRRNKEGNCTIKSGIVCPIYLFPGQFFGAVFAVSDDDDFDVSDYLKLYSLTKRELPNIRKALQNDFYQSVLESITEKTELSEVILENIDKALKIAGATLWRFEDGEPKLTKTRIYGEAARYPKDNPTSYFVRLKMDEELRTNEEDDDWKYIKDSIKKLMRNKRESDKQERDFDYSTWDITGEDELEDDRLKLYYDDLNIKLKKNRGEKPSDKIGLKSALIIIRFEKNTEAQYHPTVAYVLYFEEDADVIRASAAEMVAVVDYAFNYSDIQEQAVNMTELEERSRVSTNFLHGMKNAFDIYCGNAEDLTDLTNLDVIRKVALRLKRQLLFRRSSIAWGYIASKGFWGRHVERKDSSLLDILRDAYIYSVAEFFNPDSLRAGKGGLENSKLYKKGKQYIPPVLYAFKKESQKKPRKLFHIEIFSDDWPESIMSLSEISSLLNYSTQSFDKNENEFNLQYLPYGRALSGAFGEIFMNAMQHGAFTEINGLLIKFIGVEVSKEEEGNLTIRIANKVNDLAKVKKSIEHPPEDSQGLRSNRSFFRYVTRGGKYGSFKISLDEGKKLIMVETILDPEYWSSLYNKEFSETKGG